MWTESKSEYRSSPSVARDVSGGGAVARPRPCQRPAPVTFSTARISLAEGSASPRGGTATAKETGPTL